MVPRGQAVESSNAALRRARPPWGRRRNVPPHVPQIARRQPVLSVEVAQPVTAGDRAFGDQRLHQRDAETAGEVVVTRARGPDRVRARTFAERAHGRGGGDTRERLDQLRDLRAGEPVIAVAALGDDGEQARVDEPPEVLAGGRRRDARLRGEHPGRQRAPVPERQKHPHPRPRPLAEDGTEGCEIRVAVHDLRLDPRSFGAGRSVRRTAGIEGRVRGASEPTNVVSTAHTAVEVTFVAAAAVEPTPSMPPLKFSGAAANARFAGGRSVPRPSWTHAPRRLPRRRAKARQNRVADAITTFAGSMLFVYLHVIWFACWIGFGVEDYPYGLLTMIVSLEAIFLSTFVMISQNRADARRQVIADQQWKTVQEEDRQNVELLEISKQILALTKEVRALAER
jgi:hypothetical protein